MGVIVGTNSFFRKSLPFFVALGVVLSACDILPGLGSVEVPVSATATPRSPAVQTSNDQMPYNESADPHKDIADAFAKAKQDGKYVLLDFGANWCLDCR